MKKVLFAVLLVLTFLSAAKTHGRQYRLERELRGYWIVSFETKNDPWVEKLWFQQRIMYWSVALLTAIYLGAKRFRLRDSSPLLWLLLLLLPVSMIVAFVVMGLVSAARFAFDLAGGISAPSPKWLRSAILGTLGWWIITGSLISGLAFLRTKIKIDEKGGKNHGRC